MDEERIPVSWRSRSAPLEPVGMAARGATARALARRLLARDDDALARLSGVAGPELLVVLGVAADLPWVDGAVYLGRDADAPALLLPTTREPSMPPVLAERALVARAQVLNATPPLAVLLDPPLLASVQAARPILRATLQSWLDGRLDQRGQAS